MRVGGVGRVWEFEVKSFRFRFQGLGFALTSSLGVQGLEFMGLGVGMQGLRVRGLGFGDVLGREISCWV